MTKKIFTYAFLLGALVLLVCTGVFFGMQYTQTLDEAYEALQGEASYAASGLEVGGIDYLRSLDKINRITWIAPNGSVLYDSGHPNLAANQGQFPEVSQAFAAGTGRGIRGSTSDGGEQTMYYAFLCHDGTVLRLSRPVSAVRYALRAVSPVLWAILLVLLIAAVAAFRIANKIARPLNQMDLENLSGAAPYPELQPLLGRIRQQREDIERQAKEREQLERERRKAVEREAKIREEQASEREQLERERRKAVEREAKIREEQASEREQQILEQERLRREFTANVSHELKTPLTSISGFAEIMQGGLCDEGKMIEFAGDIYRESQRLIALVSDILRLSELDEGIDRRADAAGGESLPGKGMLPPGQEMCRADLLQIAEKTAGRLRPTAEKRHIEVSVFYGKKPFGEDAFSQEKETSGGRDGGQRGSALAEGRDMACPIYGFPRILEEITYNLCDNAIKYNHDGGHVSLRVWQEEDLAVLCVEDDGIGIPLKDQNRVFERFYRVDKSHSRQIGGTGLGLSIVKHGAQIHAAAIEMDSVPGRGTAIRVLFPKNL